jgi:anti-sigma regulatory factor (Ser/Thr protein kinase)/ActR/RegA family two-component response regulator
MLVLICGEDGRTPDRVAKVLPDAEILLATDHQAALQQSQSRLVDLVVTASNTGGEAALDLLRRIAEEDPAGDTRVVIQAADSSRENLIASIRAGAFSYFSKPHFEAAFDEILRHAASGSAWKDAIRVDSATPAWFRILARCEIATADRVIQFMNELSDLGGKERESMGFALKEILMNGMEYGGKFDRDLWVEVSYVRGQRMILYRIRDPGAGFSLGELTHSAISNPPEEPVRHLEVRESMGMRPGGYGVMLAKKLVDDLIYSEQGNDVLLIKYL